MTLTEEELRTVTRMIWSTQLGLHLEDGIDGEHSGDVIRTRAAAPINGPYLTASIQITGDWQGAVLVLTSQSLARRAASVMFGLAEDRLGADDTPDALGEIANMTAGNLCSFLPGRTPISLPVVVEGSDHSLRLLDALNLVETGFSHQGEPLLVRVLEGLRHETATVF